MRNTNGMRILERLGFAQSFTEARGTASSFGTSAIPRFKPVAEKWIEHEGLLWMRPDRMRRSWHRARELSRNDIDGIAGWRLPTCDELTRFFHSGLHDDQGWPLDFYWSQTLGANRSHHVVSSIDGCEYVHDNDNDLFHATLVRRLQLVEWTLVD